jgi:hypothetical protein
LKDFNYFLILPFLIKIYCLNFTSNRSEKKLSSSSLTAASITLHFKTFYLVIMKLMFCKITVLKIQNKMDKKNAYKNNAFETICSALCQANLQLSLVSCWANILINICKVWTIWGPSMQESIFDGLTIPYHWWGES